MALHNNERGVDVDVRLSDRGNHSLSSTRGRAKIYEEHLIFRMVDDLGEFRTQSDEVHSSQLALEDRILQVVAPPAESLEDLAQPFCVADVVTDDVRIAHIESSLRIVMALRWFSSHKWATASPEVSLLDWLAALLGCDDPPRPLGLVGTSCGCWSVDRGAREAGSAASARPLCGAPALLADRIVRVEIVVQCGRHRGRPHVAPKLTVASVRRILPKPELSRRRSGMLKLAWLAMLKKSARNSGLTSSVTMNSFWIDRVSSANPGPQQMSRRMLPNTPAPGASNCHVSNHSMPRYDPRPT